MAGEDRNVAGDERKRLIGEAKRLLGEGNADGFLAALAGDLFAHVEMEDLAVYSAGEIAAFVRSAAERLDRRKPGSHAIRVGAADVADVDGRHRDVTLVEIVNDDMPFLVDTIMAELQEFGAEILLVAHPIISVERDGSGRLKTYCGTGPSAGAKTIRESLIQIHIRRLLRQEDSGRLARQLAEDLSQVRLAVNDWPEMRARLRAAIEEFRSIRPPLPEAEIAEAIAFLEWLEDDNFIFLGVREYDFVGGKTRGELRRTDKPGLGILSDPDLRILRRGNEFLTTTPAVRDFLMRPEALIVTKANAKSRIHRRVYLDYVGIKRFTRSGKLAGELRLIGLFTSSAYTRSIYRIPFLRRKAERIVALAGFDPASHSGKALDNVLESYPRDELFQIDEDLLLEFAMAILRLGEHPRVRVLVRRDKFDRYVSVLVFIPRDRYNTSVRLRVGDYLKSAFDGRISAVYPAYPEGSLARVHFIIGRFEGETPNPPQQELESDIAEIARTWTDKLSRCLVNAFDSRTAVRLFDRYGEAFPLGYHDGFTPEAAVEDIGRIERLSPELPLAVEFYRATVAQPQTTVNLKLIHLDDAIELSRRVPILEHMGFRVVDEQTYDVVPAGTPSSIYIHDMTLEARSADLESTGNLPAACFMAVWFGETENDGYNALVVNAGLDWRCVALLRTISRFLHQAGSSYSQDYMWETFNRHPDIAVLLVDLFRARLDPDRVDATLAREVAARIEARLESVDSLDEDRIIRRFVSIVLATVRTNFFQRRPDGAPRVEISLKLDSQAIETLPEPRPFREIFVHSPRVDGIHLRFGSVARGGIRWSDRPQDFRTEILGLAKAQQVKNAVIVPFGAKGGFVAKQLPPGVGRDETLAGGIAAYRIFVSSLLDITDNLDGERLLPPEQVVRRDGDDPYLVVAADKGTATFSDIANGISAEHDFWLGDAFASGGSDGYDHKRMGITARGAWEAVKRHFREIDRDIQTTPFTVVGVGDMSGDVFGNAMLLSPQMRLVATFDHRDIFIDPDPDPKAALAERRRLFELPRSSWQDYDRKRISSGGGVFSRKEKSIRLSAEAKALLDLSAGRATPQEIIQAILGARADLLWFGGIGTFIRAADEPNEAVGDRANDAIRVVADELRALVVGEGANLGMTQKARIAFGLAGGRCNTDAIDNSAGVNTSDVEVNIKIALDRAVRGGRLDRKKRNRLLVAMTEDVARLVLRNNYMQSLAISLTRERGLEDFGFQQRLMRELERRGLLDRAVEALPDDAAMAERHKAARPLTRPEIAVLVGYAKIGLTADLIAGDITDDPVLAIELRRYFPERMQTEFAEEIENHRLRREIIAIGLANSMINRCGPTYLVRMADRTGSGVADIARAYVALRDSFGLRELFREIDALDNRISGKLQLELYGVVQDLLHTRTAWFLRNADFSDGVGPVVEAHSQSIAELESALPDVLPAHLTERIESVAEEYAAHGVPEALALRLATLPELANVTDIYLIAENAGVAIAVAAEVFFAVAEHFRISRIETQARALPVTDYYDGLALDQALETLDGAHRRIATKVAAMNDDAPFGAWLAAHSDAAERTVERVGALMEESALSVSRVSVAAHHLADLADA
jgi:glutamate dehydrogenase